MRRVICLALALLVCASLALPVFAAENEFVPSISYKGSPEIVPVKDDQGKEAMGVVRDADGNIIDYFYDCLEITSIPEAEARSTAITEEARQLLLRVYKELNEGTMELPYEKFNLDADDMVIRELLDVSWLCGDQPEEHNHPHIVSPTGIVFDVTFNLGVSANTEVYVMTYKEEEWNPIVKTVNNGDGTVTCTFEKLCPVSFSVKTASNTGSSSGSGFLGWNPKTGDIIAMWIGLMAVSAMALVAVVVVSRRKRK